MWTCISYILRFFSYLKRGNKSLYKEVNFPVIPVFSVISCGDPGVPINGRQVNVSNNYKYGSFIEFDCSENYTFSGDRKIVCGETKDWSAPLPRCFGEFYFLWHRNISG